MPPTFYRLLSDLILVVHFTFVAFVILGFATIWIGYFFRWTFIHNFTFRIAHLLAMGFVAAESVLGMVCPLTTWENELRLRAGQGTAYQESFIEHWLGGILFYDLSDRAFTILYLTFFLLILATFIVVPPRRHPSKPASR